MVFLYPTAIKRIDDDLTTVVLENMLDQKVAGKVHRVHLEVHRAGDSNVKYAKCNRDPYFAFDYYVEVAIEWIVIVICIRLEFLHVKEMVIYLFYYLGWSRGHISALFKCPGYVLSHCIYRGQERRDIEARVSKYPC